MKPPKISLIIANFNNGKYFEDCFRSLVEQTEKNWEAVLIDDASTDNSVEIIKELIKNDARFRFYENEKNLGYQKTLVRAISLINSPLFGRLDPDDMLTPIALEVSIKTHEENPKAGLVYSNIEICNAKMETIYLHFGKQFIQLDDEVYYNFRGEISHFATFKKEIYDKTEGIDTQNKRAEDKDIYMQMCETAPVIYVNEILYRYRKLENSASGSSNHYKAYYWHWYAMTKMAARRNVNLEELFSQKIRNKFVIPKTKPFEDSFAFNMYRIEKKLKKIFSGK